MFAILLPAFSLPTPMWLVVLCLAGWCLLHDGTLNFLKRHAVLASLVAAAVTTYVLMVCYGCDNLWFGWWWF